MKTLSLLLIISALYMGCDKKESNTACSAPQLDCTGINCILTNYYMDFRIVDKSTGADLVWGANPRYSTADVALYGDVAATQPITVVADNAAQLFKLNQAQPEMYLMIAGTSTYKLSANFIMEECCAFRVKDLNVNGAELCTCCAIAIGIPVD